MLHQIVPDGVRRHRLLPRLASSWLTIAGWSIHFQYARPFPERPAIPVVCVPGLGRSYRYMRPLATRLARHVPVYIIDLPGFGKSAKPNRMLTTGELGEALAAWLDAMGLAQVVLLGNSYGCQVIAVVATQHPDLVARAVLVGPTVDPHHRSAHQQTVRLLYDGFFEPLSLIALAVPDYGKCGVRRFLFTVRDCLQDRIEAKLPRMAMPTLVVRGERDPLVPQRWAEEAARLLPHGRLVVVRRAGHAVNYDAAPRLTEVVLPFLRDATPPQRGEQRVLDVFHACVSRENTATAAHKQSAARAEDMTGTVRRAQARSSLEEVTP